MSPEQIRGGGLDDRADLYSLACTLFELVSGRLPYTGASANELLNKHLRAAPPSLDAVAKNVTPQFAQLLRRAMAKNPGGSAQVGRRLSDRAADHQDLPPSPAAAPGPRPAAGGSASCISAKGDGARPTKMVSGHRLIETASPAAATAVLAADERPPLTEHLTKAIRRSQAMAASEYRLALERPIYELEARKEKLERLEPANPGGARGNPPAPPRAERADQEDLRATSSPGRRSRSPGIPTGR